MPTNTKLELRDISIGDFGEKYIAHRNRIGWLGTTSGIWGTPIHLGKKVGLTRYWTNTITASKDELITGFASLMALKSGSYFEYFRHLVASKLE